MNRFLPAWLILVLLSLLGLGSGVIHAFQAKECVRLSLLTEAEITGGLCGGDFRIFWSGGHYVARQEWSRAHEDESLKALPPLKNTGVGSNLSLYPPHWFLWMEPLGARDFASAWRLYIWGSLALLAGGVLLAFPKSPYALLLAFGYGGVWLAVDFGQSTIALTALYLLVLASLPKREGVAGALLGLATVKPHLGVLMPLWLLIRRHGRAILAALVVFGLLVFITGERYGWEVWTRSLHEAHKPVDRLLQFETVRPETMASVYAGLRFLGLGVVLALIGQAVVGVLAVRRLIGICRRSHEAHLPFAATLATTLLVLPHVYGYDLVLLLPPLLVLAERARIRGWRLEDVGVFLPAYVAPTFTMDLNLAFRGPVLPFVVFFLLHRLEHHSRHTAD